MDYEKNYKDAFGLAQDWYNDATTSEKERRLLAAMFSELKESKDERIRKGMIDEIKAILCGEDIEFPPQDVLESRVAYLEHLQEYIDDVRQYAYNKGLVDAKEKQQPAEWSEEDERNYEYLHQIICNYINNPQIEYKEREKASKVLIPFWERLKFLRPKPKQEWSEEDENIYNKALDAIYYKDCNEKDDVISALNDLCELISRKRKVIPPYAHWKPSEDQMEALKLAYKDAFDCPEGGVPHLPLQSLYQDLQKLL